MDCDSWAEVVPDVIMDATRRWPFPDAFAARIYLGQVLEHLSYPRGVRACLKQAARVLAQAGAACLISPDAAALVEKDAPEEVWAAARAGMGRWPGDAHRWLPDRHTLAAEACAVFEHVRIVNHLNLDGGWPAGNRDHYDVCILAGHTPPHGLRHGGV